MGGRGLRYCHVGAEDKKTRKEGYQWAKNLFRLSVSRIKNWKEGCSFEGSLSARVSLWFSSLPAFGGGD